MFQYTKDYNK